jgi:preprotein translocase subunit SecG
MEYAQTDQRTKAALWFGFLGGALAWTAHLLLAYFFSEFGCVGNLHERYVLGLMAPTAMIALLSALLLLVAALATLVSYRVAKQMGLSIIASTEAEEKQRQAGAAIYLARAGVIMSGLFVFVILVQSLPILYFVRSC